MPWPGGWRRPIRPGVWMATPMAAFVVLQLIYNKARFGELFEFGVHKQLNTMRFKTGLEYLWPNLYSYLLRPITASCQFPYIGAMGGSPERVFPGWSLPAGYNTEEPVAGMLTTVPWVWLVPVAAGSPYEGCSLGDTRARTRTGASIVAVVRDRNVVASPRPDFVFEAGDIVLAIGTAEGAESVADLFGDG